MDELGPSDMKSSALASLSAMKKLLNKRLMPVYVGYATILV